MTAVRVPPAAVTVMPADGSAAAAPLAGVIVILVDGARVVAPAPVLALAAGLVLGLAGPVPVQPGGQQGQRRHGGETGELPAPPAGRVNPAPHREPPGGPGSIGRPRGDRSPSGPVPNAGPAAIQATLDEG